MDEFHFLGEHNEFDEYFAKLEESLPLAVNIQRANGDTPGALGALRDIINKAIAADTPPSSRASFLRAHVLEQSFDKARLVYKRADKPQHAVASGVVSYFMSAKRLSASADFSAARAAELRSPRYRCRFVHDEEDLKDAESSARDEEDFAKETLARAFAAMTDVCIAKEVTRLLKQMKMDVALAQKILLAVSAPPNNPWEMFNLVMAAFGR